MKLRIGLIQMQVEMGNRAANFAHAKELLEKAMEKKPDILVLPETWNTGFFPKDRLLELSDEEGKETKALLSSLSGKYGVNIVGGTTAVRIGKDVYNRSFVFDRKGDLVSSFDKMHGFSLSGEPDYFRMGDHLAHFELDGIPCSMAVCYDIRFPELIRREALMGVDLFFVPAAWPKIRNAHWVGLNRARAIENQFYLAAVNEGGKSGGLDYAGESLLLDPWGEDICHLGTEEEIAFGRMDTDVIQEVRTKINVFRDRRPEWDIVE
ncbi:carbon-nitrogen family hydrolase [Dialister sp.]|uniref:carbon-nitrogen family hydrolase n=1 Tax=Dialister sp. TaxID=1955814 RepID=UPI002E81C16A|nr:carbon-nitrogen family hydrolase [Dialister sp.]MEE3452403.1 carbon-nitrogen family hydrolase [Dialister sp.]